MLASNRSRNHTSEIFGIFRCLDIPFTKCAYPQYSPVLGLNKRVIKNLRLYGHYDTEKKCDYLLPKGHSAAMDPLFSQDALAALIKLLFPSIAGLVVNSSSSDKTNDYLTPKNIARIFILTKDKEFYSDRETVLFRGEHIPLSRMKLIELMMPQKMLSKWRKSAKFGVNAFVVSGAEENSLSFIVGLSALLHDAFVENVGKKAARSGVTNFAVEQALLCYMWQRNKHNKMNLVPYYSEFVAANIISRDDVDKIIWEGDGSYYIESEYRNAGALTGLEKDVLMGLGHYYFDDMFPPALEFGICRAVIDGAPVLYADCGDTSIRNFFMMMLYNSNSKKFDISRLLTLRDQGREVSDALIYYFAHVCRSPAEADTAWARDKWAVVVNGLKYVRYRSGTYEIDAGFDNALMVIGALLGVYIKIGPQDSRFECIRDLNEICKLFSDANSKWYVSVSTYGHSNDELDSYYNEKIGKGWVDLTLTFRRGNKKVFEWHFEKQHFALNRYSAFKSRVKYYDVNDFPNEFFADKMDTLGEKVIALDQLLNFKTRTQKTTLDYLINQWLDQDGSHFAGWKNLQINSQLANVLLKYMSVNQLIELEIPALLNAGMYQLVQMRRLDDIKQLLATDLASCQQEIASIKQNRISHAKNMLASGCSSRLFSAFQQPLHDDKFSNITRILKETLLKGTLNDLMILRHAGANDYLHKLWGMSLLHLIAMSGNELLLPAVSMLKQDVNLPNKEGNTPLHFAARSGSLHMVEQLIAAGANVDAVNRDGVSVMKVAEHAADVRRCIYNLFYYDYQHNMQVDPPFAPVKFHGEIINLLKAKGEDIKKIPDLACVPVFVAK